MGTTGNGINVYLNNVNYKVAKAFHNSLNINNQDLSETGRGKQKLNSNESDFNTQKERLKLAISEKANNTEKIEQTKKKPSAFKLGGVMDFKI